MCGEHNDVITAARAQWGSSPHVRGALADEAVPLEPVGIIPACAGSTPWRAAGARFRRDHPRMCGEHCHMCTTRYGGMGSSPHVRGALVLLADQRVLPGIIPACAGSTKSTAVSRVAPWDHPRMCGEHRVGDIACRRGAGIIPACAGSTRASPRWRTSRRDHPRMCGEHYIDSGCKIFYQGSSPHVRGAPVRDYRGHAQLGIIPACAGSTRRASRATSQSRDHPRMCGEHPRGRVRKGR